MTQTLTKVTPLQDRVLVDPIPLEEVRNGIIMPDTVKEKPQQAKVLAVGRGRILDNGTRVTPDVKVGDVILRGQHSGVEVRIDDRTLIILKEAEVLAILE